MSDMSELMQAVQAVSAAAPGYAQGARFYDGTVSEVFASNLIKRLVGDSAKEYKVNLARRVVDAVLDRLKIASISVPDNPTATAKLQQVWDRNRFGRSAKTLHRRVLSQGDTYVYVESDPDDDANAVAHIRSALTTRVFYDPANPNKKTHAAFVWVEGSGDSERIRVTLLYPDRTEEYISRKGSKGDDETQFERYFAEDQDEDEWPLPNESGEVPVFHFRTDEPYGRPEHFDAYGPQNAINKLVGVHMGAVDFQGFPQRYRLRANAIQDGPSTTPFDEDEDAGLPTDGEDDGDNLQAGPGTVWDLSNTDSVGQFDAADAKNFIEGINFYARIMGATTATPLRFMDPTGDVPSGESLRADDAPLTEKIGDRQVWLGDEWSSMLRYMLKVAGVEVDSVKVTWQPVQIVTDTEGWNTIKAKIEAGVPREVALAEAGYRPDEIATWVQGWDVAAQITAAMSAGTITEEQVAALLASGVTDG